MSSGRGLVTGVPLTVTVPAVCFSMPPMMLSSVLLPQPDGPSRQTNSPLRISSETSSSASTRWLGSRPGNSIDTWLTEIAGACPPDTFVDAVAAPLAFPPALTSELHRHELVVVDRARVRQRVEDAEILERLADHLDRHRVPGAITRKSVDLRIVNPVHDAFAHVDRLGRNLHGLGFIRMDERDGLEPAAQEPAQQVGALVDHVVGRVDDVGVEMLLDLAEVEHDAALLQLLELEAGGRLDHQGIEIAALHGGEPG